MDGDENTFLQLRKEQLDRFSKSSERKKLNSPKEVDANKKSGRLNRDYDSSKLYLGFEIKCKTGERRPNAAHLAMQTFQAVHDLHALGFIHRDISPTKFIFGLDNPQIVYMIGFSLSYHFEQHYETKPSVSPRRLPKLSNRSFRSHSYHRNKEINRKDDLESWVYLSFNLFGRRLLPWDEQSTDLNMFVNKERLFCDGCEFSVMLRNNCVVVEECYKFVPRQFLLIIHNLDKVGDTDRPNYTYIGMLLITMKEQIKFHFRGPFDWQKAGHNTYDVDFDKDETLTLDAKDVKRRVVRRVSGEESYIELFPNEAEDLEEDGRQAIAQSMPPINAKKPQIVQTRKPQKAETVENESLMNKRLHKPIYRPETPHAFSLITPTKSAQVILSNNQLLMQMEEIKRQNAEMNAKLNALTVENKPSARKKKMEKKELLKMKANPMLRFVSSKEYNRTVFPTFCQGCSYLLSTAAVASLLNNTATVKSIHLEDVLYTGLVAEKTPNVYHHNSAAFGAKREGKCDQHKVPYLCAYIGVSAWKLQFDYKKMKNLNCS
ncbi:hypothetical protein M3Y98_00660800 [Aphelenchoides besseyi]|nr:hypothetical protein M3Y98_00660800 [Aphelenchoides besseyi]